MKSIQLIDPSPLKAREGHDPQRPVCQKRGLTWGFFALASALVGCMPITPPIAVMPSRDAPQCIVTRIIDGDTVDILCSGDPAVTARLTGYDTPETFRPGCAAEFRAGKEAERILETKLRQARVIAPTVEGTDRYNRALVSLTLDGADLADTMVATGLAVPYDGRTRRIDWCARLAA